MSTTPTAPPPTDALSFFPGIAEKLGVYVYLLRDPRDEEIFYVGKGKHDRAYQHARGTATGTQKLDRIREIQKAGQQVIIEVLRHGMDDETAFEVEASAIDLVRLLNGSGALHNLVAGHGLSDRGYAPLSELRARYGAEAVQLDPSHRIVFINVNRAFRPGMDRAELYEITRQWWKMAPHTKQPHIALATYRGIIRGAWRIDTDSWERHEDNGRWRFSGSDDSDLSARYEWKDASHLKGQGAQNPISYSGCTPAGKQAPAVSTTAAPTGPVEPAVTESDAPFIEKGTSVTSRGELVALLRSWLADSDELTIGDIDNHRGSTPWIRISLAGRDFVVHADTRREAIERYVELADELGDELPWHVVASARGQVRKVAVEPDETATAGLYIYATGVFPEPTTIGASAQQVPAPTTLVAKGTTCDSKSELADVLREWHDGCDEPTIGDTTTHNGNTAWIKVRLGDHAFRVHADTRRDAIGRYLELVDEHGPELPWQVTASKQGHVRKVAIEADGAPTPGLYIYAAGTHDQPFSV